LYRKMPAVTTRTTQRDLDRLARDLTRALRERSLRIVFAESCTGGLVSAVLTGIPGVSEHLCGSAVVYRLDTKAAWLGLERAMLDDPGPVSAIVAERMAAGVLARTAEADLAVSVTGHLGPDAPAELDGVVYIGIALRSPGGLPITSATRVELETAGGSTGPPARGQRRARQRQAAAHGLSAALKAARTCPAPQSPPGR
jgi:PncC family amidohydrolase